MPEDDRLPGLAGLSRADAAAAGRAFLRRMEVDGAEEDARLLLFAACDIDSMALLLSPDTLLSRAESERYGSFLARRSVGEPASRIIGRRPFWTVELTVRACVLDPRADSEALVRLAVRAMLKTRRSPLKILDLGCGSGALLCALLTEFPEALGLGVDLSPEACAATAQNIELCALADRAFVVCGRWMGALRGPFDLIVSNPPYIPTAEIAALDKEVRDHDPRLALDGGEDGLAAYRELFQAAPNLLLPGGALAVEIGRDQSIAVERLAEEAGLTRFDQETDLGGRDRALVFLGGPAVS